jgi:hypothetical protein
MKKLLVPILIVIIVALSVSIGLQFNTSNRCNNIESQLESQQVIIDKLYSINNVDATLKYFRFTLIDETYTISAINYYSDIPEILQIPSTYNGIDVTAIGMALLDAIPIKVLVIPSTVTSIGVNLCGLNCNCPTLNAIVFLGKSPIKIPALALDTKQLKGDCKIYVPDESVTSYKNAMLDDLSISNSYEKLIYPISTLDPSISSKIK